MSYRTFKRALGETNLERKCRWLFGACLLPLIMGISMFIQQKLNPAPPDPMQAKIMMSLPFVFTIFFAFFPAGLVLYWVVNNVLSISQQWYITRKIEKAHAAK